MKRPHLRTANSPPALGAEIRLIRRLPGEKNGDATEALRTGCPERLEQVQSFWGSPGQFAICVRSTTS